MKIDRSELLRQIKSEFPVLREPINQQQGLLYFEVAEFAKFTNRLIVEDKKEQTKLCFQIAEKAFLHGNTKIKDAIDTSYVEDLAFNKKEWAWQLLPVSLKKLYVAFFKKNGV